MRLNRFKSTVPLELSTNSFLHQIIGIGLSLLGGGASAGKANAATQKGEENLGLAGQNFADISSQADEWLSRYDELYRPIERGLAERVQEGPKYERAEGIATADTAMAFDKARQIEDRRLQRYGIDPSSGRYRSRGRQYDLGRATTEVQARNTARRQEEDLDWARKMTFTKMGRGLETAAVGAKGVAGSGYSGVGGRYFGLADKYGSSAGRGFSTAGKILSNFGGFGGGGGGSELLGPSDAALDTGGYNAGDDLNF